MKAILRIWDDFTKSEKRQCIANEHRCLKWGLYVFERCRYQCGCNRTDIGDFSWAELEAIE